MHWQGISHGLLAALATAWEVAAEDPPEAAPSALDVAAPPEEDELGAAAPSVVLGIPAPSPLDATTIKRQPSKAQRS